MVYRKFIIFSLWFISLLDLKLQVVFLRMLDDDMGVALFSLDQVWDGKGNYLLNTVSQSLHNYLPIGSTVKVLVR